MTHLKSTSSRKNFICNKVKKANSKQIYKIYLATEKAINYRSKKKKRY